MHVSTFVLADEPLMRVDVFMESKNPIGVTLGAPKSQACVYMTLEEAESLSFQLRTAIQDYIIDAARKADELSDTVERLAARQDAVS
jgi:hypothetical protein